VGKKAVGTPRRARPGGRLAAVLAAVAVVAVAAATVLVLVIRHQQAALAQLRPSGIPPTVSTRLADLMALSPVPARPAPGFRLTGQNGQPTQLSQFRGKVVVLTFMDTHCVNTCPLVAQEFTDAYHDLGPAAAKVVFAAVNVNPYHVRVADVLAFSREHQLVMIPGWHFVTGPVAALRAVWRAYNVEVQAPGRGADIVHTSVDYFIAPSPGFRRSWVPAAGQTAGSVSSPR